MSRKANTVWEMVILNMNIGLLLGTSMTEKMLTKWLSERHDTRMRTNNSLHKMRCWNKTINFQKGLKIL